jgi:hypothetical protein
VYEKVKRKVRLDPVILSENRIKMYADTLRAKDCPSENCFGFIDGTLRRIARPGGNSLFQQSMYSGHKRAHGIHYQAVITPDGMFAHISEPYEGRRNDSGIYNDSNLERYLDNLKLPEDDEIHPYHLYGDKGYTRSVRLACPNEGNHLTPAEKDFNYKMSSLRVSVENGFADITRFWGLITNVRTQCINRSRVACQYTVAAFLTNCITCFNGNSISNRYEIDPPSIEEYLSEWEPELDV